MLAIEVDNLSKTFMVSARRGGPLGALRGLVAPARREVVAVSTLSFAIAAGEMVGLIGPNGAGKSTTIKMLTGILVPTDGRIEVAGVTPWQRRRELAARIGVVFGQRSQLWWDLPLGESFDLLRHIYRVPASRYRANLAAFRDLLGLDEFIETPVRQLSLGQRMRGELAAALLHDPELLFLDEPTIGLDVVAKGRIRDFLRRVNREAGTTVILTTHDMSDIAQLCPRVLIVDHGRAIYDGALAEVRQRLGTTRTLVVDLEEGGEAEDADGGGSFVGVPGATLARSEGPRKWLRFERDAITAADLIARVAARYRVRDLTLEEPEIEEIVRRVYTEGL